MNDQWGRSAGSLRRADGAITMIREKKKGQGMRMYQTDGNYMAREALGRWTTIGGGLGEDCRGLTEAQRQHAGRNK